MKRKLLLMKSFLVAAGLCVGATSAWAQTTVTYDFTTYGSKTLTYESSRVARANGLYFFIPTNLPEAHGRFAFAHYDAVSVSSENGLFLQRSVGDYAAILGLSAGDKVTITLISGNVLWRSSSTAISVSDMTNYTGGSELTTTAAGNLYFRGQNTCKISTVVIVTSATETMTAPSVSSEASGSARTVTITDGASSLLSPVTTYYTTDGTDPTASSTKYTAPFDVDATCTVKAITISNSSASTASTVTSQLIDMDAVDVPTAAITAVDGINRTVTFSCTTDGATLYYSTNGGETYTEGNSLVISANTNIKVKATKGTASAESEVMAFEAGTAITLNTPSWTKTGYSEGVSTVTLSDDQSSKLLSPVSTIKYSINDGKEQTYSSAISVNDGEALKYWSVATGYTNSTVGSVVATAPNTNVAIVSENYAGVVGSNNNLSLAEGEGYRSIYYNSGADLASEYLLASNINSSFNCMMYRANGLYSVAGWNLAIADLKTGDYVTLNGVYGNSAFGISSASNMTADEWNTTAGSKYCYTVDADGQVTFTMARYGYLTSITIQRASVSKSITDAGWATYCSPYALDLSSATGLTDAYIVTGGSEGVLKTTSVKDGTVAANTGLLLEGSKGTVTIPVVASGTDYTATNKLVGVTASETLTANGGYVLMAEPSVAFYKNTKNFTLTANTAYLPSGFDGGLAPAFYSLFDSETTGVGATLVNSERVNNEFFNLQGQRVGQPTKGLYIVNGKKIVKK